MSRKKKTKEYVNNVLLSNNRLVELNSEYIGMKLSLLEDVIPRK